MQRVAHLLSRQGVMGRPRADDRKTLNAILYVLITGLPLERPCQGVRQLHDGVAAA